MLQNSKRLCLICLLLFCGAFTLGDDRVPESNKRWEARPSGRYQFLRFPYENKKEAEIRASLPFRRIKLQKWGPPNLLNLTPGVNYYIEFHVSGEALLHAISGTEKDGIYKGQIDLTDYARLCLLYETLISEVNDPKEFGVEVDVSHPVISELTMTFTGKKPVRRHRNDANFGDFKFWVFENVFENIESKVKWKKVNFDK